MIFTKKNTGFTIVELTIIIVVIAILAAIAIIGYGTWRTRTSENTVKSDLGNALSAMESKRSFSDNGYPVFPEGTIFDGTNQTKSTYTPSSNVQMVYKYGSSKDFCIEASIVGNTTVKFSIDLTSGSKDIKTGGCPVQSNIAWQSAKTSTASCPSMYGFAASGQLTYLIFNCSGFNTYVSQDGGTTWVDKGTFVSSGYPRVYAVSTDGMYMYAGPVNTTKCLWRSGNYGTSFSGTSQTCTDGSVFAISGDGSKVIKPASATSAANIELSTTYGNATWTTIPVFGGSGGTVQALAMSRDGSTCAALAQPSMKIAVSTNGCTTWTSRTTPLSSTYVEPESISDDGSIIAALAKPNTTGAPYGLVLSKDKGQSWNELTSLPRDNWTNFVMSGDGQRMAVTTNSNLYVSSDGGDTWQLKSNLGVAGTLSGVAISRDGSQIGVLAAVSGKPNFVLGNWN